MRTPWEAGVFVYRDDRLLLMHRADDRYWHVVAGVVEYGEGIADGALRELREESGLVGVDLMDLGSPVTYPITPELRQRYDYPPDVREVTAYSFAARAPAGWEPTLNEEHDEYRWTTVEEALSLLYWPEAREAVRRLAARLGASA
ncbi:MAG: NUDIX domain-containing protein [Chloroflexota bacterium]|nr:NUDIX domain-containing protein [Chloroflexota bacterium]